MSRNHPVWDVYDEYRTTRLSCKYYSARLGQHERWQFWMEMILAATAPGSAIAGWALWGDDRGKWVWMILMGVSALLAIMKPLLRLYEKAETLEAVTMGYNQLDNDYKKLVIAIRQEKNLTPALQDEFRTLMDRARDLRGKEVVERVPDKKLRSQFEAEVARELPVESFFVPSES